MLAYKAVLYSWWELRIGWCWVREAEYDAANDWSNIEIAFTNNATILLRLTRHCPLIDAIHEFGIKRVRSSAASWHRYSNRMIIAYPPTSFKCVTTLDSILVNKSPSHYGIHSQLLKTLAPVIPNPFTIGTWLSLGSGIIPNGWSRANIKRIYMMF